MSVTTTTTNKRTAKLHRGHKASYVLDILQISAKNFIPLNILGTLRC